MGKWISSSGKEVTTDIFEQSAAASGMTADAYASTFGFKYIEDEGKQNGSKSETPDLDPTKPAGESRSGNTLLVSPENEPYYYKVDNPDRKYTPAEAFKAAKQAKMDIDEWANTYGFKFEEAALKDIETPSYTQLEQDARNAQAREEFIQFQGYDPVAIEELERENEAERGMLDLEFGLALTQENIDPPNYVAGRFVRPSDEIPLATSSHYRDMMIGRMRAAEREKYELKKERGKQENLLDPNLQTNDRFLEIIEAAGEEGLYTDIGESAGQKRLEELFDGMLYRASRPNEGGFVFDQAVPTMDYIDVSYVDEDGVKHEGPRLSFDETEGSSELAENTRKLKEFVNERVTNADAQTKTSLEYLVREAKEETEEIVSKAEIKEIEDKINSPYVFREKRVAHSSGSFGIDGRAGAQPTISYSYVQPYATELKAAREEINKRIEAGQIPSMSKEDLTEAVHTLARKNIIAAEILELKQNKARAKLRDASEWTRAQIEVAGIVEIADLNVEQEKREYTESQLTEVVGVMQLLDDYLSGSTTEEQQAELATRLLQQGIRIDPTKVGEMVEFEDGTTMDAQFVNAYQSLFDLYQGYELVYEKQGGEILGHLKEIEDLDVFRQQASKSYNYWAKAGTEIVAGFGDIILGLGRVGRFVQKYTFESPLVIYDAIAGDTWYDEYDASVTQGFMDASMTLQDYRNAYVANITFDEAFDSGSNFALFGLQEISTQIPIITAIIASGGTAAPYVIGASSMGQNMVEMEIANKYGGADYSEAEIFLKSLGVGAAEGVFAGLTTVKILKNGKIRMTGAGKPSVLDNTGKQYFKDNILQVGLDPVLEAAGEVATQTTQNIIMERPMMEGVDHAGFSGFGMGMLMSGLPFMRGVYLSGNSTYNLREGVRNHQREIIALEAELAKADTDEARARIMRKIQVEQKDMADEISRVENLINNHYRGVHADQIRKLSEEQAALQNEVVDIMNDNSLSEAEKQQKIDKLEVQFQIKEQLKQASLNPENMQKARGEFIGLIETDKARYNRLMDEARLSLKKKKGDNVQFTDQQIQAEAYDLYFKETIRENNAQASNVEGAELTSFETKQELLDFIANDGIVFDADPEVNQALKENAFKMVAEGADGFNVRNEQYVAVENQLENQRKQAGTHEVGHYVFDRLVDNKTEAFDEIAAALLKHARSVDKKLYNELNQETHGYEVISRFLEMVADRKIDYRSTSKSRSLLGLFGVNLQAKFKEDYDFDFKGEQDIVNFVVGMGKKISDGTLTIRDIEAAEGGVVVTEVMAKAEAAEAKKKKTEPLNKAEIEADAQRKEGIDIINNTDTKFSSRAADRAANELAEMQEQGYDPNNYELYDILNGMVGAQLSKYKAKGLQITDMEEATADIVGRLYTERDVNKFDGRGTLYGYLNGRIKFRTLDAFKSNPIWVENFSDIDAEGLTGKQVQEISIEPVEETKTVADKPSYRTLTQARTVSEAGMRSIKDKVLSTVRVMKTRMDQAVSKNVTVKPYIAELKKDFGKQTDIIIKKEMGGLKDRQLEKWLLSNKKPILENMTTTWLMTAMPNAVQKKVNGQWTSDWKGKKIDRETTSTDKAGRTSGAELVRRLPMASINMSDADFLSNFFNPDGSLIRGRKESLAKAIGEEISFELFSAELQTEGSPIREAFETRQDLLQTELTDNFIAEVNRDIERGNVKFSEAKVRRGMQGIDAYLKGDVSTAEGLFSELPKGLADRITTFIDDQLVGLGIEGFKAPLKNAVYPDNLNEIFDTYLSVITNRNNPKAIEEMLDLTEELIDRLPPELLAALPKDVFGLHDRYGNKKLYSRAVELEAKLNARKKETSAEVLPFNPKDIRIFQGGNGLMDQIANNILNKDFETREAKIEAYQEKYGETVAKASIANKAALEYILDKMFDIAANDPTKMVGILRLFEGQTNMGNGLRGLTGLSDIEFYAESQGAWIDTKTGRYYSLASKAGKGWQEKIDSGRLVVNKNHPLYNDAVKYIDDYNAKSKTPSKLKPEDLLKPKGEHALPSAKMWFGIADIMLNRLSKVIDNPTTLNAEAVATRIEVKELVDQFNQQLNSNIVSKLQDDAYGKTSEAGDFRLATLSEGQQSAFRQTIDGEQTIGRAQRKMRELLNLDNYVDAVDELNPTTKFSQAKPKAVFMVGGPGAGKTNVGKGLKLGRRGFKVVNQDLALEPMKEEAGLPANEQRYTKEQRSMRAKLGAAARKAAEAKMDKYKNNSESMVVDGTGASYNATMKKINALRDAGYEVSIVFANTSKAEAVARNKARAERALPDFVVERTWDSVQESAKQYKEEFGDKFYELNTNELKMGENLPTEFLEKLYNDLDVNPSVKFSEAKKLNAEFNEMLERKTGMGAEKRFSKVQAELRGRKKGRFKFFVAPGADDFRGLVHYAFAGKGKQGDADMAWFEEKLMNPYFKGVEAINRIRQSIKSEFKAVIKVMRPEYKMLNKKIGKSGFTYDHAVRVYLWNKAGIEVPGLSKRDTKLLLDAINENPSLADLANALLVISRRDAWADPSDYWQNQTVLSDLNSMTEKIGRKKFLQEFIDNADVIFSEDNLNKIEALYGRAHREAIEDALYSMKNGTNRPTGSNATVNKFINWINGSTGAIMFFNRRSALLQMLSAANFINWSDNNPMKAAAAFANQKQYWADFAMIFNSDKLKERRSGLKTDVSESELASAANRSKGNPQAILAYLLKLGFTPTQIADSMAIATGGATFYRNRVNKYIKQGLDKKQAEERAWLDFTKKSDEAQQSSDPALVSQQQRSVLGRLVFAFANTPMQYTRLMKKAAMDLKNGRGDMKENISKILYYGFIQNFIFSSLQSGLFALIPGFDDEDEDLTDEEADKLASKEEAKITRVLNGMLDTVLRGSGIYGAVTSTLKNTLMEYAKQEEKGFMADHTYTIIQATSISPPINSKLRKIYSAIQTKKFERDELEVRPWGVQTDGRPNFGPAWSITGSVVSGTLNIPLDRVVDELNSIGEAMDERNTTWQRIALALGWKTWDVGAIDEEGEEIKAEGKRIRKEEGIKKAQETKRMKKEEEKAYIDKMTEGMSIQERAFWIKDYKDSKKAKK